MSKCRLFLQVDQIGNTGTSSHSIKLFALYRRKIHRDTALFRHYFTIIGYGSSGVQEEGSYRIDNAFDEKFNILYSDVSGPSAWAVRHTNMGISNEVTSFEQDDIDVHHEFQELIANYLIYEEDLDCFLYKSNELPLNNDGFYADPLFPIKYIQILKQVYWPFAIGF